MSIQKVREYLKQYNKDKDILEMKESTATVELAAQALGIIPARIAKSLAFEHGEGALLVVAAGDAKVDNKKFKGEFGVKAKMLSSEDTKNLTGHAIGGVCPFALPNNVDVFLDISMKRFMSLFPACGSKNSAVEVTLSELEEYSKSIKWVDVCKSWE